jgi:flagellar hook-associated protein 2
MLSSIAQSLGAGSGINTPQLVQDLATASRAPKVELFDNRARAVQARISAVSQARSDLASFSTSLAELVAGGTIQSQPVVSDANVIAAVAAPGARLGNFSGEIDVQQIAKSQTIYSAYLPDATTAAGQGTMVLSVGGTDYPITIDGTNDNMFGLATAINATGSGVQASVITDGGGARIVLKGQTGDQQSFSIAATSGDPGLQRFTYSSGTGGMTLAQVAQDARFLIDGIPYTRPTNSVSDVVPGIVLTLKKAAPGVPVTLSGSRPTELLRQTLGDFVAVFNTLKRDIATARVATGGDGGLRTLDLRLSALVSKSVTSDPAVNSLSDIGISTNRDGSLSLNTVRLEEALRNNPDAVEAIFSPTRDATHTESTDPGIAKALMDLNESATASGGVLDGLKQRLDKEAAQIAKNREKMEEREDAYLTRLERQFGRMDSRIAAIKATQSYLEQQIKLWSNES